MLFDQHSVSLTSTPRNLKHVTCLILQPPSGMSGLGGEILDLREWMSMHLAFEAFSLMPLLDIHEFATFRRIGGVHSIACDLCQ